MRKITGSILVVGGLIGILCCAVVATIFYFKNPDMTELRRFLEYPAPTILAIIFLIGVYGGNKLIK